MPDTKRSAAARWRIALAAAVLAALWFAMLTVGAGPLDDRLLAAVYAGGQPQLVALARALTWLGDWRVVITISLVVGAWLWIRDGWRYCVAVVGVTLVGRALVSVQKYGIERLRPSDEVHLVPVSTPSFPSGHSAGSMMVYLTIALVLTTGTRWKWPAVAAALVVTFCVGLSRLMLGVHWPTDVIGGWAFGLLWVLVALPQAERLAKPGKMG